MPSPGTIRASPGPLKTAQIIGGLYKIIICGKFHRTYVLDAFSRSLSAYLNPESNRKSHIGTGDFALAPFRHGLGSQGRLRLLSRPAFWAPTASIWLPFSPSSSCSELPREAISVIKQHAHVLRRNPLFPLSKIEQHEESREGLTLHYQAAAT